MKWNPYQDHQNRACSNLLTMLFPEQTKTIPRILIWSVIFLADLVLIVGGAFSQGLIPSEARSVSILLPAAVIGLFWLQGYLWGLILRLKGDKL